MIKAIIFDFSGVIRVPGEKFLINSEISEFIKKLKAKGIKTAILSNSINRKQEELGIFDATIFSGDVGLLKPDPEIYLLATKELNVEPKECIFIDDLEENLLPAKKLGMKIILAKNTKQIIEDVLLILSDNK